MARRKFTDQMHSLLKQRKLSVRAMHSWVVAKEGFVRKLADVIVCDAEDTFDVPSEIEVSQSTVLRWMHACHASYVRYEKGFTDRRNDADVVEDRKRYIKEINEAQKRSELYVQVDGATVLADQLRARHKDIEECSNDAYQKFTTYYTASGQEIPKPIFTDGKCRHGHSEHTCKCDKVLVHWGHDEAIFWCNLLSSKEWMIDGERCLRPKTQGQGIMVSAVVDEERGFGIPVTDEEFERIKPTYEEYRTKYPWFQLPPALEGHKRQIGTVFFKYGKGHRDRNEDNADLASGWWNCSKFKVQCEFLIACFGILYGDRAQLLFQIDQSSGHMSNGADTLDASHLGLNDGGVLNNRNRPGIRDTRVYHDDLGEFISRQSNGMIPTPSDPTEKPLQYGHYPPQGVNDRYDSCGPKYHKFNGRVPVTIPQDWQRGQSLLVRLQVKPCSIEPYRVEVPDGKSASDTFHVNINEPGREWWRGIRKGTRQLLFETGHIDPDLNLKAVSKGLVGDWGPSYKPSPEEITRQEKITRKTGGTTFRKRVATAILQSRRDFQEEQSVIGKLFVAAGHMVIASPKYHPEIAGQGIEYCWGKSKYEFRNYANNLVSKNLERNVQLATGSVPFPIRGNGNGNGRRGAPLPVERVRKFARKARTYRNLFVLFPTPDAAQEALKAWRQKKKMKVNRRGDNTVVATIHATDNETVYSMIDKLYALNKTHCNLIDVEYKFCVD